MKPGTPRALPDEQLIGRRVRPRTACNVVVEIKDGASDWQRAFLADMSATGFRLTQLTSEPTGTSVWLRLPRLEPLAARIRWRRAGAVGCEFLSPLDMDLEARLKRLVAQ